MSDSCLAACPEARTRRGRACVAGGPEPSAAPRGPREGSVWHQDSGGLPGGGGAGLCVAQDLGQTRVGLGRRLDSGPGLGPRNGCGGGASRLHHPLVGPTAAEATLPSCQSARSLAQKSPSRGRDPSPGRSPRVPAPLPALPLRPQPCGPFPSRDTTASWALQRRRFSEDPTAKTWGPPSPGGVPGPPPPTRLYLTTESLFCLFAVASRAGFEAPRGVAARAAGTGCIRDGAGLPPGPVGWGPEYSKDRSAPQRN